MKGIRIAESLRFDYHGSRKCITYCYSGVLKLSSLRRHHFAKLLHSPLHFAWHSEKSNRAPTSGSSCTPTIKASSSSSRASPLGSNTPVCGMTTKLQGANVKGPHPRRVDLLLHHQSELPLELALQQKVHFSGRLLGRPSLVWTLPRHRTKQFLFRAITQHTTMVRKQSKRTGQTGCCHKSRSIFNASLSRRKHASK